MLDFIKEIIGGGNPQLKQFFAHNVKSILAFIISLVLTITVISLCSYPYLFKVKHILFVLLISTAIFIYLKHQNNKIAIIFLLYFVLGSVISFIPIYIYAKVEMIWMNSVSVAKLKTTAFTTYIFLIGCFCLSFLFITLCKHNKYLKIFSCLLCTVLLLLPLVNPLFYGANYIVSDTFLGPDAILAVYQTNTQEAVEYFNQHVRILRLLVLSLLTILYLILAILIIIFCSKLKDNSSWIAKLTLTLIVAFSSYYSIKYHNNIVTVVYYNTIDDYNEYVSFNKEQKNRINIVSKLNSEKANNGTYVFVIGESQTRAHMSAYGYNKAHTTPWLSKIKEEGFDKNNFIFASNAFSCHTHTVSVLLYALTAKNQYNQREQGESPSIIEMTRYAGKFDTYWISNQGKIGIWETPISVISSTSTKEFFSQNYVDRQKSFYDEVIVNKFSTMSFDTNKNNFIVIHLMGCHGQYANRYPKEFSRFKTGDEVVDTYNNSMLYNDYIISKLYQISSKIPNLQAFVYMADHGEDSDLKKGHNSGEFTSQMSMIPLYFAFSDSYIKQHKNRVDALLKNQNQYFTNDLIFDTLLGIMGVTNNEFYDRKNDLSSDEYKHDENDLTTLYGQKSIKSILSDQWYISEYLPTQHYKDK